MYDDVKFLIEASAEDDLIGRLINHCKRHANVKLTTKHYDDSFLVVLFTAKWEICVGEQLLFDYSNKYVPQTLASFLGSHLSS
uniref:SET domain-containing protein n=1 Tax=Romanomermis culicivorax TaxID=13658 RepID=A0A915HN72_ROMCU